MSPRTSATSTKSCPTGASPSQFIPGWPCPAWDFCWRSGVIGLLELFRSGNHSGIPSGCELLFSYPGAWARKTRPTPGYRLSCLRHCSFINSHGVRRPLRQLQSGATRGKRSACPTSPNNRLQSKLCPWEVRCRSIPALSRGLSVATPPDSKNSNSPRRGGSKMWCPLHAPTTRQFPHMTPKSISIPFSSLGTMPKASQKVGARGRARCTRPPPGTGRKRPAS